VRPSTRAWLGAGILTIVLVGLLLALVALGASDLPSAGVVTFGLA
jgi:hypothetical protein